MSPLTQHSNTMVTRRVNHWYVLNHRKLNIIEWTFTVQVLSENIEVY